MSDDERDDEPGNRSAIKRLGEREMSSQPASLELARTPLPAGHRGKAREMTGVDNLPSVDPRAGALLPARRGGNVVTLLGRKTTNKKEQQTKPSTLAEGGGDFFDETRAEADDRR
jgi:hypothetical protein